jgi:hypothetical protein
VEIDRQLLDRKDCHALRVMVGHDFSKRMRAQNTRADSIQHGQRCPWAIGHALFLQAGNKNARPVPSSATDAFAGGIRVPSVGEMIGGVERKQHASFR